MAQNRTKDEVRNVRLDTRTLQRIEQVIRRHERLTHFKDFSFGEPHVLSQAQVLRLAVLNGLDVLEKKLAEEESRRKGH